MHSLFDATHFSAAAELARKRGRAGTGKSTLAGLVTEQVRNTGKDVLNVATTGQAAMLLPSGATAHSVFGIPLDDDVDIICMLGSRTAAAERMARISVIQWDEWPSTTRNAWEAVLRYLHVLEFQYPDVFVKKTIVRYGDVRQPRQWCREVLVKPSSA